MRGSTGSRSAEFTTPGDDPNTPTNPPERPSTTENSKIILRPKAETQPQSVNLFGMIKHSMSLHTRSAFAEGEFLRTELSRIT